MSETPTDQSKTSSAEKEVRPEKEVQETLALIKQYLPLVLTGIALAVIIAFILLTVRQRRETAREIASELFLNAGTAEEFKLIIDAHPKSPEAPLALLALASSKYRQGAYAEAELHYRRFLEQHSAHPMRAMAEIGLAHCDEAAGRLEAAAEAFTAFAEANPGHFLTPLAQLGAARTQYALGHVEAARAIYEPIINDPEHPWQQQAETEWQHLQRSQRVPVVLPDIVE